MKVSKILFGGIAGSVTMLLLGGLIYQVLLKNFVTANFNQSVMRSNEDMIMWAMILAYLGIGFLLSIVFSWTNSKGMMAGATVGGVIGLLAGIYSDFSMYSISTIFINTSAVFVDIIIAIVISAIGGVVVALVMGIGKKDA
jgi:hypothetical protein